MFKKILASLATIALGIGLAVTAAIPAQAGNTDNTNEPANWVVVSGEVCEKYDFNDGPTTLNRAALDLLFSGLVGNELTKVIIKAGSGGSSVDFENTAYYEDAQYKKVMDSTYWLAVGNLETTTFQHIDGADGASGKNISHVIVCYVDTPDAVSGDANVQAQTCDTSTYTLVDGWIAPVSTTGVTYELYAADKTTLIDGTFDAQTSVAFGTYWVKVLPASSSYTVSVANTWLERTVGAYVGTCAPTPVSGDANVAPQTCDETDTLVDGWIAPVSTTGVTYELYAADKTTLIDGTFDAQTAVAFGTYWVKVLPASSSYTVSVANTWLERTVGAYVGTCAPTPVSGDANVAPQTCDTTYTLVDGWIAPVSTTGVTYELYAADKTTLIDGTFDAQTSVAFGTYWVKVLPASSSYTVSVANTWLERTVGAYVGTCKGEIKTLGDPFDTQECIRVGDEELPSTWSATLTIVAADHVQYRVFFHDGLGWDEQGLWAPGVYTAGPGGDFPYGTKIKVVAEAVGNYTLTANPYVWEFEFTQPFNCQQTTEGTVTPVVTFAQTCSAGATYTLAIEGGVAGTVLFSVNGGSTTTTLGTFAVGSPSSISIVATPGPGSGFDGEDVNELTFTKEFPALAACGDLTTLALTGDNVTPTLWVVGLLGLLGSALIRTARRFSRVTTQKLTRPGPVDLPPSGVAGGTPDPLPGEFP